MDGKVNNINTRGRGTYLVETYRFESAVTVNFRLNNREISNKNINKQATEAAAWWRAWP